MYKFSQSSRDKLKQVHPDLQLICTYLIAFVDFTIVTGYRSPEEQLKKYYAKPQLSKVKVGKHNSKPSMAIDIQPYPLKKDSAKSQREQFYYLAGCFMGTGKMLKEMGLISHDVRSGGDWNKNGLITDNSFDDLYHFELI